MIAVDQNGNPVRSGNDSLDSLPVVTPEEQRLKPRLTGTGAQRGQQTLVGNDGSKIVYGILPDDEGFCIAFYNSDGSLVFKQIGTNRYSYDENGDNFLQEGIFTDGTRGFIIVKSGNNVDDVVST